jgi:hypothetical protein
MGQLLHMIFLTFFSMLIFSNTVTSLSTIYLSSDLLMLMSSPLRLTTVFVAKFLQTLLYSSWMSLIWPAYLYCVWSGAADAGLLCLAHPYPTPIPGRSRGSRHAWYHAADAVFPSPANPQGVDCA